MGDGLVGFGFQGTVKFGPKPESYTKSWDFWIKVQVTDLITERRLQMIDKASPDTDLSQIFHQFSTNLFARIPRFMSPVPNECIGARFTHIEFEKTSDHFKVWLGDEDYNNSLHGLSLKINPQTHKPTNPQTHKPTNPQTHKPTNPQTHKPTNPHTTYGQNLPELASALLAACKQPASNSPLLESLGQTIDSLLLALSCVRFADCSQAPHKTRYLLLVERIRELGYLVRMVLPEFGIEDQPATKMILCDLENFEREKPWSDVFRQLVEKLSWVSYQTLLRPSLTHEHFRLAPDLEFRISQTLNKPGAFHLGGILEDFLSKVLNITRSRLLNQDTTQDYADPHFESAEFLVSSTACNFSIPFQRKDRTKLEKAVRLYAKDSSFGCAIKIPKTVKFLSLLGHSLALKIYKSLFIVDLSRSIGYLDDPNAATNPSFWLHGIPSSSLVKLDDHTNLCSWCIGQGNLNSPVLVGLVEYPFGGGWINVRYLGLTSDHRQRFCHKKRIQLTPTDHGGFIEGVAATFSRKSGIQFVAVVQRSEDEEYQDDFGLEIIRLRISNRGTDLKVEYQQYFEMAVPNIIPNCSKVKITSVHPITKAYKEYVERVVFVQWKSVQKRLFCICAREEKRSFLWVFCQYKQGFTPLKFPRSNVPGLWVADLGTKLFVTLKSGQPDGVLLGRIGREGELRLYEFRLRF